MVIQGRTSLMLLDKDSDHPDFTHLKSIEKYVDEAADLTRKLLGFARGGKYEITPADLNALVKKSSNMFGRTKKEIKINPEVKVLLSIGYSINGQATEILNRGCNGFIQKPFNLIDLSHKIRGILD